MVYAISLILPLAYFIGLLFTMKTHSAHVFGEFEKELKEENAAAGKTCARRCRAVNFYVHYHQESYLFCQFLALVLYVSQNVYLCTEKNLGSKFWCK